MLQLIALGVYSIVFLIVAVFLVLLFLTIIDAARGNAPFVPIRTRVLPEIEGLLHRNRPLTSQSVFIDPGCGNGKVLTYLAQKHPDTQFVGIEINLLPYLIARFSSRKLANVSIVRGDIFAYDYRNATHVFTYLFPELIDPLYNRIIDQARKPIVLITCDFTPSKLHAVETIELKTHTMDAGLAKKLYLYIVS